MNTITALDAKAAVYARVLDAFEGRHGHGSRRSITRRTVTRDELLRLLALAWLDGTRSQLPRRTK